MKKKILRGLKSPTLYRAVDGAGITRLKSPETRCRALGAALSPASGACSPGIASAGGSGEWSRASGGGGAPGAAVPLAFSIHLRATPPEARPGVCGASPRLGTALLCGGVTSVPQQGCGPAQGRWRWRGGGGAPLGGTRRPPAPPPGAAPAPPPAPGSPRGCAQQRSWEALTKTIAQAALIQ